MAGSSVREIITLQFGHYSNFIGTHWWNIQESSFCYDPSAPKSEINHDCLFREGRTVTGQETFTPRLLLYDLKGSLRNLPSEGLLYSSHPSRKQTIEWDGGLTVHETNPDPKNEFQMDMDEAMGVDEESGKTGTEIEPGTADSQDTTGKVYDLDNDVLVWSDYLGTQLHPRSVNLVGDYLHDAETFPFDVFGYGQSLYRERSLRDEFEDGLHFYIEECDSLQGFQILTDVNNGFGGITSGVLEDIADEYSTKSVLTFGSIPSTFPCSDSDKLLYNNTKRILNFALSFSHLSELSSLFVPLSLNNQVWPKLGSYASFPHINYKGDLPFHTSAILASYLDTITLPYRLDTPQKSTMRDFIDTLAFSGRNIAHASVTLPLPVNKENSLASMLTSSLDTNEHQILQSISPLVKNTRKFISQAAVMRGVPQTLLHSSTQGQAKPNKAKTFMDSCQSGRDMLNTYFQSINQSSVVRNWSAEQKSSTKSPFPNIFSTEVDPNGVVTEGYARPSSAGVEQTSVLAGLGVSPAVGSMLDSLVTWANKVNIQKHHEFLESGIEFEDFKENLTQLTDQAQRYNNP